MSFDRCSFFCRTKAITNHDQFPAERIRPGHVRLVWHAYRCPSSLDPDPAALSPLRRQARTATGRAQLLRAQRADLPANLTLDAWITTLDALEWACAYCHGPFDLLDHVVPLDQHGGTTALNCVPACRACNAQKTHTSPRRAELAQFLTQLHALPDQRPGGTTSVNALALQTVFVYVNTLRLGLGISLDTLSQRSGIPVRGLHRYFRQPPDSVPSAFAFLRLIATVGADASDMAALLAPMSTQEQAMVMAEQRLVARMQATPAEESDALFQRDLLVLLHTLKHDAALLRAVQALVAGWDRIGFNDELGADNAPGT